MFDDIQTRQAVSIQAEQMEGSGSRRAACAQSAGRATASGRGRVPKRQHGRSRRSHQNYLPEVWTLSDGREQSQNPEDDLPEHQM